MRGNDAAGKATQVKTLSRVVLVLYLITLLWLVLFKLSYDIPSILANYQTRSLSLIPFVTLGNTGLSETMSNVVTFIPFGLLLGSNFKKTAPWRLLVVVFVFSVTVETVKFIFAIGTTDATDVVTNTIGGLEDLIRRSRNFESSVWSGGESVLSGELVERSLVAVARGFQPVVRWSELGGEGGW